MKTSTVFTALVASGAIIIAGQAMAFGGHKRHAEGHRMGGQMMFEEMDANADGKLSKEEMAAGMQGPFAKADANSDGKITKDEATAAASERAGRMFDRMLGKHDADKDGALTMDEIKTGRKEARMEKMFDRLDADEDGFISQEEMKEMRGKGHGKRMSK